MLRFYSANVRIASTQRAVQVCFENAFGGSVPDDLQAVFLYTTIGHKLKKANEAVREIVKDAVVFGASCGGVIGPDGPGESMNEMAIFAIAGSADELTFAAVTDVTADNSRAKAEVLAEQFKIEAGKMNAVFITVPGLDCACDSVVYGIEAVLGEAVPIFGGVSSDNMKNITSYQLVDGEVSEHAIWAVAIADPTIGTVTRATHGFDVIGEPMTVTKVDGNKIVEINGQNAILEYSRYFKLTEEIEKDEMIPFGALAEQLPEEYWEEYGSPYVLHGVNGKTDAGELLYRVHFKEGTDLRMAIRNETLIFSEMKRILEEMRADIKGEIIGVLQADCVIRGRFSLNAVMKEELIGMMQESLAAPDGEVPAWFGMYGFGEFAMLGGHNRSHTYTSSLMALYRKGD